MCVQQSNTVDICDIECVWRALCMADCCDKDSARFVYRADCHSYHCKYKFNWCIAHQSSCSDTYNFECNGVFVDCLKKYREKSSIAAGLIRRLKLTHLRAIGYAGRFETCL